MNIGVVVNVFDEDSTEQYIDLVGAVGDTDTVMVNEAPLLVDVADLDVSLEDLELPGHSVTDDLVVVFAGNVDAY